MGGWTGGLFKSDNKAKLSQLELELGLSLAIRLTQPQVELEARAELGNILKSRWQMVR